MVFIVIINLIRCILKFRHWGYWLQTWCWSHRSWCRTFNSFRVLLGAVRSHTRRRPDEHPRGCCGMAVWTKAKQQGQTLEWN
jgi:hypothetical protein